MPLCYVIVCVYLVGHGIVATMGRVEMMFERIHKVWLGRVGGRERSCSSNGGSTGSPQENGK